MGIRTDLMEAVIKFRYHSQGWSERMWLSAGTYSSALPSLALLVAQRRAILPNVAQITYARVSFVGAPRERQVLDSAFPLAGLAATAHAGPPAYAPVAADANDVETALFVQFSTATGRWANYYYRCLPDDVVAMGALTTPLVLPSPNPSPNEATWFERVSNWIALLTAQTVYARFVAAPVPPAGPSYDVQAWTLGTPRGLANRKTGLPFGVPAGRRPVA